MKVNRQEIATGALFIAIGLFFGISALIELPIGSIQRMGPGFLPIILAGGLILVGLVVGARGLRPGEIVIRPVPWRALAILLPVPVLFGLTIRGLGLVPAVFLAVFIATFGSRRATLRMALILALTLTAFCAAVFHYGLNLPLPLFGPWMGPLANFAE